MVRAERPAHESIGQGKAGLTDPGPSFLTAILQIHEMQIRLSKMQKLAAGYTDTRVKTNARRGRTTSTWLETWRPRRESNPRTRICNPLRNHSATWPHGEGFISERDGIDKRAAGEIAPSQRPFITFPSIRTEMHRCLHNRPEIQPACFAGSPQKPAPVWCRLLDPHRRSQSARPGIGYPSKYEGRPIEIIENARAYLDAPYEEEGGRFLDVRRIDWYRRALVQLARSIADGAKVRAFHAWTIDRRASWRTRDGDPAYCSCPGPSENRIPLFDPML